jgi:hypothetical protein
MKFGGSEPGFRIGRFARSLGHAVVDAVANRRSPLPLYCDTDVALGLIFGADAEERGDEPDFELWLAYALIAGGFVGQVTLLRPHLVELDRRLKHRATQLRDAGSWKDRMMSFLERPELDGAVSSLLDFRRRLREGEETALNQAVDFLRSTGWRGVLALELVRGEWRQRLRQLSTYVLQLGSFDGISGQELGDPGLWSSLNVFRNMRPDRSHNNFCDALAVTALMRLNKLGQSPRFFTGTRAFTRLLEQRSELRDGLLDGAEGILLPSGDQPPQSVLLRDSHYILVRASFAALSATPGSDHEEPSLDELLKVAKELAVLQAQGGVSLTLAEKTVRIGGRPLLEVMEEIESLAFVRNVLCKQEVPKPLLAWLNEPEIEGQDGAALISGDTTIDIGRRLSSQFALFKRTMTQQYETVQQLTALVENLFTEARRRRSTFTEGTVVDFDRDLGAVRWGGGAEEFEDSFAAELLARLVGTEDDDRQAAAEEMVLAAVRDGKDTLHLATVAWAVGALPVVVAIINRCDIRPLPVGLNVMRTAARLKGGVQMSAGETEEHITELHKLTKRGEQSTLSWRLRLGLGYCCYYAAVVSKSSLDQSQAKNSRDWLERSLDLGIEAYENLGADSLGKAFAINHCAYVATALESPEAQRRQWIELLMPLRNDKAVWNYRFADTIAWSQYSDKRTKKKIAAILHDLEEIGPTFGDLEIEAHISELKGLL